VKECVKKHATHAHNTPRLKGEENMTAKSGTSSRVIVDDDDRGKKRKIYIPPPLENETDIE